MERLHLLPWPASSASGGRAGFERTYGRAPSAISVTDISTNLRGDLVLYDSAGGQLTTATSASNSFGADADLTYSVSTAGTYYLLVTEEFPGEVPLVGSGRTLPDIASHPYTLTVTSP